MHVVMWTPSLGRKEKEMIYIINLDKKKEFEKWNYKQILKHFLLLIIPGIIIMDFVRLAM